MPRSSRSRILSLFTYLVVGGGVIVPLASSAAVFDSYFLLRQLTPPQTDMMVVGDSDRLQIATSPTSKPAIVIVDAVPTHFYPAPSDLEPLDRFYFVKFEAAYTDYNGYTLSLPYSTSSANVVIAGYDWQNDQWTPLPSTDDTTNQRLSFTVDRSISVVGIFRNQAYDQGNASWYVHPRYPTDYMAASTKLPKGTWVEVTNTLNGKKVEVLIKDWGPDPAVHPDRIIDLSKVAFEAIASTGAGVVPVVVRVLYDHD